MSENIKTIAAAIDYIECHLHEKLNPETVANAVHYSKYHLHRMFADTLNFTLHDYIRRRRLTEAARALVFSDESILETALEAGYDSRQSFTDAFKAMYKMPPDRYRKTGEFYPLQLKYVLNAAANSELNGQRANIALAKNGDIAGWMKLVRLVVDGFPHLDEKRYAENLREYIRKGRALILKDGDTAIGIMAFNETEGHIDFLGVHPQYRKRGIAEAFCQKALYELAHSGKISVTTFREGDKADTGYREMFKSIGFAEAEMMIEFGYPTQRLVLSKDNA